VWWYWETAVFDYLPPVALAGIEAVRRVVTDVEDRVRRVQRVGDEAARELEARRATSGRTMVGRSSGDACFEGAQHALGVGGAGERQDPHPRGHHSPRGVDAIHVRHRQIQ
jgi:hypothetical protein